MAGKTPQVRIPVTDMDRLLLLTEAQLKVWLYYRRRLGADGKAWGKSSKIAGQTHLEAGTVRNARSWLVKNGWLKLRGYHNGYAMYIPLVPDVSSSNGTASAAECHPEMTVVSSSNDKPVSFQDDDNEVPTPEVTNHEALRPSGAGVSEGVSEALGASPLASSGGLLEAEGTPVSGAPAAHEVGDFWFKSTLVGKEFGSEDWDIAAEIYQSLLPRARSYGEQELRCLAEVMANMQEGYGFHEPTEGDTHPVRLFWRWNQTERIGKWRFATMADMHKAWFRGERRAKALFEVWWGEATKGGAATKGSIASSEVNERFGITPVCCDCGRTSFNLDSDQRCQECAEKFDEILRRAEGETAANRASCNCTDASTRTLDDGEMCPACKFRNTLSARKQRHPAWQAAEAKRKEKLARFEFRGLTSEEQTAFKALRGEGWRNGIISEKVKSGVWQGRHCKAAMLRCLNGGSAISFGAFALLVEEIAELEQETPYPVVESDDGG